jgi:DNA polymerase I-like protein with 3'-5' exonuclease and polymerase domains
MGILVDGDEKDGKRLKDSFLAGFPKLQKLVEKLTKQYNDSKEVYKEGFIHGADGRRIYVNSPHKVLNYLLQGNEAIYMKHVMVMADRLISKNNLRANLLCFYHDELNMEVHPDDVEGVVKIMSHSFKRAGELLGFNCPMASDPKVGVNWYEIH